jgi:hypothetical protein
MLALFQQQASQVETLTGLVTTQSEQLKQQAQENTRQQQQNARLQEQFLAASTTLAQQQQRHQPAADAPGGGGAQQPPPTTPTTEKKGKKPDYVKTVKKKLDKAIEETGKIANKINRATASLEGLNQIDFEELKDANKPLHHRVPNFIRTMKTPAIVYDEGMEEFQAEKLKGYNDNIATQLRALQSVTIQGLMTSTQDKLLFYNGKLAEIRPELTTACTEYLTSLNSLWVSAATKQQIVTTVGEDYDAQRDELMLKIEAKRVDDSNDFEQKQTDIEDAKLQQLESASSKESLAVVTRALVRQEIAEIAIENGDAEEMDEDNDLKKKQINAALDKQVVHLAGGSKNGRAARAQKAQKPQKPQKQKPQKPQTQKGKGKTGKTGKGKGKGGRGGGGTTGASRSGGRGAQ